MNRRTFIRSCVGLGLAGLATESCSVWKNTILSPTRARSASGELWWNDEVNVVSWAGLGADESKNKATLDYIRSVGASICDRGVVYGNYPQSRPQPLAAQRFHSNGLKTTSFISVPHWDPAQADAMIEVLKKHLDDGCDGVHMDMFHIPLTTTGAFEAAVRIRDEVKRYGHEKCNRSVMVAGNLWKLENAYAVSAAAITDVVWLETFGTSESEIIRICRLGRAIGNYRKPVWVHWQPAYNAAFRVEKLVNLPKAQMSACLFEDAVFLCNPRYAVFDTRGPNRSQVFMGARGKWSNSQTTEGWRQSVIQYSRFVREHRELYTGTRPQAPLLLAFRPKETATAHAWMSAMLQAGIPYVIKVHGETPFAPLSTKDLKGYRFVASPVELPVDAPDGCNIVGTLAEVLKLKPETDHYLKTEGAPNILGRLATKGKQTLLHLKQCGYTDAADGISRVGPLRIMLRAPGVRSAALLSPDQDGRQSLKLECEGERIHFTVPSLEYYSVVVLE